MAISKTVSTLCRSMPSTLLIPSVRKFAGSTPISTNEVKRAVSCACTILSVLSMKIAAAMVKAEPTIAPKGITQRVTSKSSSSRRNSQYEPSRRSSPSTSPSPSRSKKARCSAGRLARLTAVASGLTGGAGSTCCGAILLGCRLLLSQLI